MPNRSAEYESHKAEMAEKSRQNSVAGRDISPLPEVADPARRESCRTSLRLFCETYLGAQFPMSWSDDHITAITRLETVGIDGGQFAFAMPRGSGKTTLCQATAIWATLYAHRRFVVLIGATEPAAEELLDAVRVELETNDLLAADFPEVCYPIGRLDGIVHRANGQHIDGERTRMSWTAKEMVFPTVSGSKCSGIVIRVAGITGRVRGMRAVTSAGESIRPDLVIVDDPQTDDSARSPSQNDYREKVLTSAVLGLSGPGKRIAAIMPCTVIVQGDMADRLLDRDRNPQWHGERAKLVYAFPTDEKKWDEYARIRREDLRSGGTGAAGTEYYRENRKAMDAGAKVGWEERFEPGELSAIQHAMNIRIALRSAYLNRGLGTESMRLASEFALEELKLEKLTLTHLVDNHRAHRAYEKVGFIDGRQFNERGQRHQRMSLDRFDYIRAMAENLMAQHLDTSVWSFGFDSAKRRAGLCSYTDRHITISKYLVSIHSFDESRQVMLHEIAHALSGKRAGHGKKWLETAKAIGYRAERFSGAEIANATAPWVGYCPAGHEHFRYRRPTGESSCGVCGRSFSRANLIRWQRRED